MEMRMSELAGKEIINLNDGMRMGLAGDSDLVVDPDSGNIQSREPDKLVDRPAKNGGALGRGEKNRTRGYRIGSGSNQYETAQHQLLKNPGSNE
jgi:sporulation protein YlmC with PRC-barrel domain